MTKQLYQFYLSHPDNVLEEDCTSYVVTLDKLDFLLTNEGFLTDIEAYVNNITGYKVDINTKHLAGCIGVTIQYMDSWTTFKEETFTLVPVKSFI
jgi:hypothetical protein